jgi:hypothetical protein
MKAYIVTVMTLLIAGTAWVGSADVEEPSLSQIVYYVG